MGKARDTRNRDGDGGRPAAAIEDFERMYAFLAATRRAILRAPGEGAVYESATRIAVEIGGFTMAWIGLTDAERDFIVPVARHGKGADYVERIFVSASPDEPEGRGPAGLSVREGRAIIVRDVATDECMAPWREEALRHGYRAAGAIPFRRGGEIAGLLAVYAASGDRFDDRSVSLLEELADDISYALDVFARETHRAKAEERRDAALAEAAKSRDAAVKASEIKSVFLATINHEIRTPLNVIQGFTDLMIDRARQLGDEEMTRDLAPAIRRAIERLASTVQGVLDFSKMTTGDFPVRPAPTRVAEIVEEVVEALRPLANEKTLTLRVENHVPDAVVVVDPYCLGQSLRHLVDNAVKFTERGKVVVRVSPSSTGGLEIVVEDSGMGIPPDYLPRLFTAFTQADSGLRRRFEGTGLGLALVKRYLEADGLDVDAKNLEDGGARFRIIVPASKVVGRSGSRKATSSSLPLTEPAVLVVEDDLANQALIARCLQGTYSLLFATTAAEGREFLERHGDEVAIVLMDISLRGTEDGLALTRWIRERREWDRLPVLVVTAHTFSEDEQRAHEAGCDGFLPKPFLPSRLRTKIRDLLESTRPG